MRHFPSFLLLVSAASTTLAWSHLFDRAPPGCLADNCLRAVTGTQPGQTQTKVNRAADCSAFLVQTVTPATVTVTATASVTTATTLSFTTTTTTTAPANGKVKRIATTSIVVPAYASPCSGAVRYSSACSCAGWLPSTVTAPVPTVTNTVSTTLIKTIDATATSIIVSSLTSTIASSSTPVGPPACTSTAVIIDYYGEQITYSQVFIGRGVSENPNNPSNQGYGSVSTTFPASMEACDAVSACATWGLNSILGTYNIDLHFALAENQWVCVGYDLGQSTAADYNVANSDIGAAMGYDLTDFGYGF